MLSKNKGKNGLSHFILFFCLVRKLLIQNRTRHKVLRLFFKFQNKFVFRHKWILHQVDRVKVKHNLDENLLLNQYGNRHFVYAQ